jgi:hypothetical protein
MKKENTPKCRKRSLKELSKINKKKTVLQMVLNQHKISWSLMMKRMS